MELRASVAYLKLANVAFQAGMIALSDWMRKSSAEEHGHAAKLHQYLVDRGVLPVEVAIDTAIELPQVTMLGNTVLALEESVTASLTSIATLAEDLGDRMTRCFVEDMIEDQVEGESDARKLVSFFVSGADVLTVDAQVRVVLGQ